tara:strand:- start:23107 stop:24156 length:1050 start_codon:yes stop_codon:yes gene_type:complete
MNETKKKKQSKKNTKDILNQFSLKNDNNEGLECIYRNVGERESCDLCSNSLRITEEGFLVCVNDKCGIIYKDIVDSSAEWRYYGADDNKNADPTRCGLPINPLLKESSYGCKIMCAPSSSYEMRKIKRYTEWQSMPYHEHARWDDFQFITCMATNSGLPKIIIDDALRYYTTISKAKTFRGLNRDGILAASIYIACSINKNPRTAKEIALIFKLDNTSATKGCKNALTIINDLEAEFINNDKTVLHKTTPSTFIARYCSKININHELTQYCLFIAQIIEKRDLIPENTPHSISAGIVYFVSQICNLNITKKDINIISGISEVTINKCFKKLENIKELLVPKKIQEKYNS